MPSEKKTALVAAVEILAKRLVSTAELRSKLVAKKLFSPAEIDEAVLAVKRIQIRVSPQGDNHLAVRFLTLTVGGDKRISLQRRMDDAPLIGIHRFKIHTLPGLPDLDGDIFRKIFQRRLASLPVILRVKLDTYICGASLIYHKADQVLE